MGGHIQLGIPHLLAVTVANGVEVLAVSISLQNDSGCVRIQRLLNSHWAPGIVLSVGKVDIVHLGNESVVFVVGVQCVLLDLGQIETEST